MLDQTPDLSPPSRRLLLLESRAAIDFATMLGPLARATLRRRKHRVEALVIVAPGFGSGDGYTLPLRRHLNSLGYRTEGWGLGTNLAGIDRPHTQDDLADHWEFEPLADYNGELGVPYMADLFIERVRERHEATGLPIILIGWSLGGVMAREAARELPEIVQQVITLGTPTVGGPKYTAAAGVFSQRGTDVDWIEARIRERDESRPIQQPITAIVSRTDGVVGWQAAIDRHNPNVEHIEIDAAHLGMGFNQNIWRLIRERLRATTRSPTPV